jgi:glucokinase
VTPSHATLAIDIGATKVALGIVTADGRITEQCRVEVAAHPSDLFSAIVDAAKKLLVDTDRSIRVCGVACAGPMGEYGAWVSPLNIAQWRAFPLRDELARALGIDVAIEGDVRALALAEGRYGSARGLRNFFSLVVSTGIGGAIVMDGRLLDGNSGNAGHLGHVTVVPDGRQCSCGAKGCLEAEASGWAIRQYDGVNPEDADAAIRHRTAALVGRGVGTLAAVLDVDRCFVAGSIALGYGEDFFRVATASAREVASMHYVRNLRIEASSLGHDGPLLGAALVGSGVGR